MSIVSVAELPLREQEICCALRSGLSVRDIAEIQRIKMDTVRLYIRKSVKRLKLENKAALVRWLHESNVVHGAVAIVDTGGAIREVWPKAVWTVATVTLSGQMPSTVQQTMIKAMKLSASRGVLTDVLQWAKEITAARVAAGEVE